MYAYINCFILTDIRQARVLTLLENLILFLLSTLLEVLTKVLFSIFWEKEKDTGINSIASYNSCQREFSVLEISFYMTYMK